MDQSSQKAFRSLCVVKVSQQDSVEQDDSALAFRSDASNMSFRHAATGNASEQLCPKSQPGSNTKEH